ncbi:MAG: recombinase family protein [Planctomycetes bacterium]|nr:recombinase family protein [Planctomycetota bacterium]
MSQNPVAKVRCAIYCRTSSDERLGMEFNSLEAQRDAGESYVRSQRGQGWVALPEHYDDGGFSGGTLERPALARLIAEVEAGRVDAVVIYKFDRLSRSLVDFTNLAESLASHGARIVSVTQTIDTGTSMGKLMLNVLLSFAQYEREIAGERIRDKIAASKRKGLFLGSTPVFGYDIDRERKRLVVNAEEAAQVVRIFRRFLALGSATAIAGELNDAGLRTKSWTTRAGKAMGGFAWNKAHVYRLLSNRIYLGEIVHKDEHFDGQHEAIVERELWNEVHAVLQNNHRARGNTSRKNSQALLKGLIRCGPCGSAMSPTFTNKRGKTYRYYSCQKTNKVGPHACRVGTVPAGMIEEAVLGQMRALLRSPEVVAETWRELRTRAEEELGRLRARRVALQEAQGGAKDGQVELAGVEAEIDALEAQLPSEVDVVRALDRLDPVWKALFPAERARIAGLLVARVDVAPDGLELRVRTGGLGALAVELGRGQDTRRVG